MSTDTLPHSTNAITLVEDLARAASGLFELPIDEPGRVDDPTAAFI